MRRMPGRPGRGQGQVMQVASRKTICSQAEEDLKLIQGKLQERVVEMTQARLSPNPKPLSTGSCNHKYKDSAWSEISVEVQGPVEARS